MGDRGDTAEYWYGTAAVIPWVYKNPALWERGFLCLCLVALEFLRDGCGEGDEIVGGGMAEADALGMEHEAGDAVALGELRDAIEHIPRYGALE